jgi:hypothetical protein
MIAEDQLGLSYQNTRYIRTALVIGGIEPRGQQPRILIVEHVFGTIIRIRCRVKPRIKKSMTLKQIILHENTTHERLEV